MIQEGSLETAGRDIESLSFLVSKAELTEAQTKKILAIANRPDKLQQLPEYHALARLEVMESPTTEVLKEKLNVKGYLCRTHFLLLAKSSGFLLCLVYE